MSENVNKKIQKLITTNMNSTCHDRVTQLSYMWVDDI